MIEIGKIYSSNLKDSIVSIDFSSTSGACAHLRICVYKGVDKGVCN